MLVRGIKLQTYKEEGLTMCCQVRSTTQLWRVWSNGRMVISRG